MADAFHISRSDAVLVAPVSFERRADEAGADRHTRRAAEAAARVDEMRQIAADLGVEVIRDEKQKWYRVAHGGGEVLWNANVATLTGRFAGLRLPSAHVLDVESWAEQLRSILTTGGLDLRRADPFACRVVTWSEGQQVCARSKRQLALDFDHDRRMYVGSPREVAQALLAAQAGQTGVLPRRLYPIVPGLQVLLEEEVDRAR